MSRLHPATGGRTWSLVERKVNGRRHIALVNTAYRDFADRSRFPWFLLVSIPLLEQRRDGLCTRTENAALNQLEDIVILPTIAPKCQFHFIGRTTHNGARELAAGIACARAWVSLAVAAGLTGAKLRLY